MFKESSKNIQEERSLCRGIFPPTFFLRCGDFLSPYFNTTLSFSLNSFRDLMIWMRTVFRLMYISRAISS
jgi:hypothetical protein